MTTNDATSGGSTPLLVKTLERRAERGKRPSPAGVIGAARHRTVGGDRTAPDLRALALVGDEIEVGADDHGGRVSRHRAVLAVAAAVSVVVGLGALTIHARTDRGVGAAPAEPQAPLPLVDTARHAAVDRCGGDRAPTATIIDRRPDGVFVGLINDDLYKLCIFPDQRSGAGTTDMSSASPLVKNEPADPAVVFPAGVVTADPPVTPHERFVWGRVRSDVASVIVATSSGNFAATMDHGLYAAWWPGRSDDRVAVHAYDATGRELLRIDELECVTAPRVKLAGRDTTGGCPDGRPADDFLIVLPPPPVPPSPLAADERTNAVGRCHSRARAPDAVPEAVVAAIVDARAAGRFVAMVTDSSWFSCVEFATPDANADVNLSAAPGIMGNPVGLPGAASIAEPIVVIGAKAPDGNMIDGNEVTWVWGRVDPSVTSVVVSAPSGTFLATVEHGLFAAWWPGNDGDRTVVRALDATGREIAFADQLSCGDETGAHPRLVVGGTYVTGGCPTDHDLPAGVGAGGIPDPPAPPGS